ncbi:MAG: type II secretion system protein GspE [Desulfobacterales bacterium C00003060]|nr:MAG: type II secretion system protein GspE [Desulfobacterales bacterium S3730MH5]OEU78515.1 MAG: type II secretion system protein GspE [Desulfobacterales bacterium C00003060]OEU84813.1 MAG: type II secretion system protein GspE [Desulfobacterales bacterium S5133MH4]
MSISFHDYPKEPVVISNLSIEFMKQSRFIPLHMDEDTLKIAMADPQDFYTIDALKLACDLKIGVCRGIQDDILEAIERLYGAGAQSIDTIIEEAGKDISEMVTGEEDVDLLRGLASEAPIIRLVNRLISNAVELMASDIHFEPFEDEFKVRYRIDGVLNAVESPPKRFESAIISRVKIMAKLDIAERRLPQDGRVKLKISDREIDFRVSTIPTLFGESLVMRILDRETLILDLEKLGFPKDILSQYIELVSQPHGMILVTGPTGSGKTSTLYTTLAKVNSPENKIITLEEPVEYQLKGVNQIQVNPKIGLSFASGLRSIVRQDPDIILVGEIRDKETAEIAIQSALTGHLLFSTLHTNDAAGAITRLLDMDVENFLLSSTLLGILAQRLVRVICPNCKASVNPEKKLLRSMGLSPDETAKLEFYAGKGCEECRYTGFKGRTAIFEYLAVDDDIRKEITESANAERIKHVALKKGMITLRQDGWRKVKQGMTTIPEVLRVTLER